ncbi:MAG: hypothetical protein EPO31_15775 [Gammaproteobacteria bacterium]|nr:MAG: hypothetical protein EPO31_15775 [Gammaproteobacteria bacterium]
MRLLLLLLGSLAIAFGIGIFLERYPGRVLFSHGGISVQISLALFVVALIVFCVLFYLALALARKLWKMPRDYRRWRNHKQHLRAEKLLHQGCLDLLEGNWIGAERNFSKGAAGSRLPLLNYLFAARAAQHQQALTRRDKYLDLAREHGEGHPLALGLTQAELQLQRDQHEQAHALLRVLHGQSKKTGKVKLMLLETSLRIGDWRQAIDLLDDLARARALTQEQVADYRIQAYTGLLARTNDRGELDNLWKEIPKKLRRETRLIGAWCQEALRHDDHAGSESLLRQTLKKHYDGNLIRLYGLTQGPHIARQLAFAEGLLKDRADDPELLLALGRLCLQNKLWGKARSYLQECVARRPEPEIYRELARLHETEGDARAAAECYRAGLEAATKAQSAPAPARQGLPVIVN